MSQVGIARWTSLSRFLPQGRFTRGVATLAFGTAVAQALGVLSSPILTRLYLPEDFGVLAVYTSTIGILVAISSLRYQLAIPLPKTDETAANVLYLSFLVVCAMTGLSIAILFPLKDTFAAWTGVTLVSDYWWLITLCLFASGMYQCLNFWELRKKTYPAIARSRISQGVGVLGSQVGLGVMKYGSFGLVFGDVLGRIVSLLVLGQVGWRRDRFAFASVSWNKIREVANRYRRFPLVSSWSALVNTAGLQVPALLIAGYYGTEVTGSFSLALMVIWFPAVLIGQSMSRVYFGEIGSWAADDPVRLKKMFLLNSKRFAFFGALPAAILAVAGEWLFLLVFGDNWGEAGMYARYFSPMVVIEFGIGPLALTLSALERHDLQLSWDVIRLLLVVLGLSIPFWLGLSPRAAMIGYSFAASLAYGIQFFFNLYAINHRIAEKESGQ